MAGLSVGASLEHELLLTGLLVVDFDLALDTRGQEIEAVGLVVTAEQLVVLIVDLVELLARSRVPVSEGTVGVSRDHNVLGHTRCGDGSPSVSKVNFNEVRLT